MNRDIFYHFHLIESWCGIYSSTGCNLLPNVLFIFLIEIMHLDMASTQCRTSWVNISAELAFPLQLRRYECYDVSNHQPHNCLLNCLFRRRSKKISKLRVTGPCEGNTPGTGEFPAKRASSVENVSIWWHHHFSSPATSPMNVIYIYVLSKYLSVQYVMPRPLTFISNSNVLQVRKSHHMLSYTSGMYWETY